MIRPRKQFAEELYNLQQSVDRVFKELIRKEKVISSLQRQLKKTRKDFLTLQRSSVQRIQIPILKGFYLRFDDLSRRQPSKEFREGVYMDGQQEAEINEDFNKFPPQITEEKIPIMDIKMSPEIFEEDTEYDEKEMANGFEDHLRPMKDGRLIHGPFFSENQFESNLSRLRRAIWEIDSIDLLNDLDVGMRRDGLITEAMNRLLEMRRSELQEADGNKGLNEWKRKKNKIQTGAETLTKWVGT